MQGERTYEKSKDLAKAHKITNYYQPNEVTRYVTSCGCATAAVSASSCSHFLLLTPVRIVQHDKPACQTTGHQTSNGAGMKKLCRVEALTENLPQVSTNSDESRGSNHCFFHLGRDFTLRSVSHGINHGTSACKKPKTYILIHYDILISQKKWVSLLTSLHTRPYRLETN